MRNVPLDNKVIGSLAWAGEEALAIFCNMLSDKGDGSIPLYEHGTVPLLGALDVAHTCQGSGDTLRRLSQETGTSIFPA